MDKNYAIMRMEKLKSCRDLNGQERHDTRENMPPNANQDKSYLNQHINFSNNLTASEAFKFRTKDTKFRRDAVYGITVVLTATSFKGIDLDDWKLKNYEWLINLFGKENIHTFSLHMDEETPHIHATIIPMYQGKLNAKHYIGGTRNRMVELQTNYAKEMSEFGLCRGEENSKTRHTKPSNGIIKNALEYRKLQAGLEILAKSNPEKAIRMQHNINAIVEFVNVEQEKQIKKDMEKEMDEAR